MTGVQTCALPISASLTFANQNVGSTSTAQPATLNNIGSAILLISSIVLNGANPGDFAQTSTCGSSVAPGGNCTISVTFTPTTTGRHGASVAITDNAAGSPQTVTLTGNAQRPLRPRLPHGFSMSAPHSVRVEHRERP